jgi:hypothetical protein
MTEQYADTRLSGCSDLKSRLGPRLTQIFLVLLTFRHVT